MIRFRALQARLVPRSTQMNSEELSHGDALVNQLVGSMPEANQRKLGVFLLLIDMLAVLRGLRPFRNLPPQKQDALLYWLFDCPVGLLRKGFWGLNSVAKLSVYGQVTLHQQIGYHLRENPND